MKLLYVFGMITSLTLVAACGGTSQNPVKDYHVVAVKPTGEVQKTQVEMTSPFQIDIEGANDTNYATFTEDQQGSVTFRVRVLDASITGYELTPVQLPQGAGFARSPKDPNLWVLTWTPPRGTVAATATAQNPQPAFTVFNVEFQATVKEATNPIFQNVVDRSRPFEVIVSASRQAPVIKGLNHLTDVNEGETVPFTVVIADQSNAPTPPTVSFGRYDLANNLENYKGDGSVYITSHPSAPAVVKTAEGWQYNFVFDTKNRDIPYPLDRHGNPDKNANNLNVCFVIRAVNAYGVPAPEKSQCLHVNYAAQAAVANFDSAAGVPASGTASSETQVTAGATTDLKFTVSTPNGRGSVEVQNITSNFVSWSGKPALTCSADANNASLVNCELKWDVPCTARPGKKTMVLKATTTTNGRQKVVRITRDFVLNSPVAGTCATPTDNAKVGSTSSQTSKSSPSAGQSQNSRRQVRSHSQNPAKPHAQPSNQTPTQPQRSSASPSASAHPSPATAQPTTAPQTAPAQAEPSQPHQGGQQ